MSSTKSKIEPAEVVSREEKEAISRPAFTTNQPKPAKQEKVKGPKDTPKQMMRIGRDWDHITWCRAFDQHCKNEARLAYSKRNELK